MNELSRYEIKIGILLEYSRSSYNKLDMIKKPTPGRYKKEENPAEKDWENPTNPEKADDIRDLEKLERAKKEADRRNENLTDQEEE